MFGGIFILLAVWAYVLTPITLVWGWLRWVRSLPQQWTFSSISSFAGLVVTSASALSAVCLIAHAGSGGFERPGGYSLFYKWVAIGGVSALIGSTIATVCIWQKSAIRWLSIASGFGMLAFWWIATTWP